MMLRRCRSVLLLACLFSSGWVGHISAQGIDPDTMPALPNLDPEKAKEEKLRNQINTFIDSAYPLSPEQIRRLRRNQEQQKKVMAEPFGPSPPPKSRPVSVSLDPSAPPVNVNLIGGMLTSISFFDASGKPWPFVSIFGGNDEAFDMTDPLSSVETGGAGSHTLIILPKATYARGNVMVLLAGAEVPLDLNLQAGGETFDQKLIVNVQEFGPNFAMPISSSTSVVPDNSDPLLADAAAGIAPEGAVAVPLRGASSNLVKAWRLGDALYVRSSADLLGPAWLNQTSSGNYKAYKLPNTPPVHSLWMTYQGREFDVKVEG